MNPDSTDSAPKRLRVAAIQMLVEDLDLSRATRKYALDSLQHPRFLASHWRRMLAELRLRGRETDQMFRRWFTSAGTAFVS